MYHFVADNSAEPFRLSNCLEVSGQICQYLKPFQLQALRFLHTHYDRRDSCILNDESGLGKCATTCVFLGAILEKGKNKCLIVVQNDEDIVGWQFHLDVLSRHLTFQVITQDSDCIPDRNLFIAKWSTLNAIGELNRFDFNYIIIDNRGQILNNNFCLSMLLKYYEKKVNILISSIDITSDLKLFYNALRLCGRLEHQYSNWKLFEKKFKLPNAKEVSANSIGLEEYFLKREILIDYCKDFRLRRFRHQQIDLLPLVDITRYKNNLDTWRTEYRNKEDSSIKSSESIQEINTEDLFEQYIQSKREKVLSEEIIDITNTIETQVEEDECVEVIDTPVIMSPLLVSESENESEGEAQCTDSVIEVISVDDSDEKLPPDAEVNKKDDITSSNTSELGKTIEIKKNLRKSANPTKILQNKKLTRSSNNILGKTLRNRRIKVVEESKEKRNNTKQKDNNQEKTHTTARTKKGDDISENIVSVETKNVNKPKTRSTINAAASKEGKIRKTVNKTEGSTKPSPIRNLKDSKNEVGRKIKVTLKDRSRTVEKTPQKNKPDVERDQIKQGKYNKKICDKSNQPSENLIEPPKRRSNNMLANQKTDVQLKKNDPVEKNVKTSEGTSSCTNNAKKEIASEKSNVNKEKTSSKRELTKNSSKEMLPTPKQEVKSPQKSSNNKKTPEKESIADKNNLTRHQSKDLITVKTPIVKPVVGEKVRKTPSSIMKRELAITPLGLHSHETRGMKRATRSSGGSVKSKYMIIADWSLDIDRQGSLGTKKVRKKSINKVETEKIDPANDKKAANAKVEENNKSASKSVKSMAPSNNNVKLILKNNPANKSSQTSFLPMSEYEDIPCGQKLTPNSNASLDQNQQIFQKSYDFLVPPTPPSLRNLANPSFPLNTINIPDSELVILPSKSANCDVIFLSSSQDEGSVSSVSSLSRRTRVLKRKEVRNKPVIQNKPIDSKPKGTFSELVSQQNLRKSAKSPDIFSNCSDVLTCSQINNNAFEGFKIFGSEVKQFQQQYARSSTASAGPSRDRSCLELLEKIFEPRTQESSHKKVTPKKDAQKTTRHNKRADIVPALPVESTNIRSADLATEKVKNKALNKNPRTIEEDAVFEITNNGTFGNMIRINSNGDTSPVQPQQQQLLKSTQHNKITNYLIGSLENDLQLQRTPRKNAQLSGTANGINGSGNGNSNVTSVHRKSPKSKQTTQNTKLTKWFSKNSIGKPPANEPTYEMQDNSTRKSPIKRRRLELSFNK